MKRHQHKGMQWFATVAAAMLLMTGCTASDSGRDSAVEPEGETVAALAPVDLVKRGEYLVNVAGCHDCHTPWKMTPTGPAPDMELMLSGHPEKLVMPPAPKAEGPWIWAGAATNTAFAGPWGVSYAMNLTPDTNTGLGIWTEEMFIKALRTGKHFGAARPIMPPMPWQNLSKATDEDLKAIYAYLRSIKPISNRPPDYQPPQSDPAVAAAM